MNYGKLGETEPHDHSSRSFQDPLPNTTTTRKCSCTTKSVLLSAAILLLISCIVIGLAVGLTGKSSNDTTTHRKPTQAISRACDYTRYPTLCLDSLLDFPGAMTAQTDRDLVHIQVNLTLNRFSKALDFASEINNLPMDPRSRSAYEDCLELLQESVELLDRSLVSVNSNEKGTTTHDDVLTWLSSALTNQDTCEEGLTQSTTNLKNQMFAKLKDLSELVSNSLAIFAAAGNDFSGIPINNRRLLVSADNLETGEDGFPKWLSSKDRKLLATDLSASQANIIVSKDGNGTYKTIAQAIKKVPENSPHRFVIYIKAGVYEEDILKVGRKKTNLMIVGEGMQKTIIKGGKSVADNMTTFHTATFAATGAGFIAKDITFENYAGPAKHQAVALRIGADHAVIYRCQIIGYQDTLYVHSNRQFYRECEVYGTVDFIFGNAAVVLQNCNIYARKPMLGQKNTITAQNRKDPNQNTGISIHTSKVVATKDLEVSKGSFQSYLGRPWKLYSRVVYMQSNLGDHIHPQGWLAWNATFAFDTLFYGEYMNSGPGAGLSGRVKWPGYHILTKPDAYKFTVGQFILGSTWLPQTGVAYLAGLQL
ncbi:esterase [Lithospermum erythrorhizon]|uniref:Pectinesterase n=1 Tax=Lithospermum erythrorhizon TaxID=34254 RepID=A0AAV3QRQ7_LITER